MKKIFILSDKFDEISKGLSGNFSVTESADTALCAVVDAKQLSDNTRVKYSKILAIFNTYEPIIGVFDDFVVYPFTYDELIARIKRLTADESIFYNGELCVDFKSCTVTLCKKTIHLTMLEYRLICLLARSMGSTVCYEAILSALWGSPIGNEIKSLRVFVNAIRAKLGDYGGKLIKTVTGKGYMMQRI